MSAAPPPGIPLPPDAAAGTGPGSSAPPGRPGVLAVRLGRHLLGPAAGAVLAFLAAACVVWPLVSPWKADEIGAGPPLQAPGWPHVFGTGELGEDVFTQVMAGGRTSLLVGVAAALAATILGTGLGVLAGYVGGWADVAVTRLVDLFLTAPPLAVLIALAAVVDRLSVGLIVLVIAALSWMQTARLVRAEVLALREREFVLAARALGASGWRIVRRHILPNVASVVAVSATLLVALAIITESTLSFLGLGLPAENPSWGNLLDDARDNVLAGEWWLVLFPGLAIVLTVLCVSVVGDALRDALDPRSRSGRPRRLRAVRRRG